MSVFDVSDYRQELGSISKHLQNALQSRMLPAVPPNRHQITLLVREADLLFFPESDLLAVASQSMNELKSAIEFLLS